MIIRPIQKEDITKGLVELIKQVWYITQITDETFDKVISNDNYIFVCEYDNKIIGCATLHTQTKFLRDGGIAGFIEDVIVSEEYRGKNIGSQLITQLKEKAVELGCYKVILSCFPEKIPFYEKNEFIVESTTMRYSIK